MGLTNPTPKTISPLNHAPMGNKVIVSQSQQVICLAISVYGEEIDIGKNAEFLCFQRTAIIQDLEFLRIRGVLQYDLNGNILKSKLIIPFNKIDVDRSQGRK